MTHPVNLPLSVARCPDTRTEDCGQASGCAHALVAHLKGRPVQDFSIEAKVVVSGRAQCPRWMDASLFRRAPDAAVPVVHETPRGLL